MEVTATDELTWEVQKHLVAVAMEIAKRAPGLYGPSPRAARAAEAKVRGHERASKLEQAKSATAHSIVYDGKGMKCSLCHLRPSANCKQAEWLMTPCARIPAGIDPSHQLQFCQGVFWCQVCGATGTRGKFIKLGQVCRLVKVGVWGRRVLAALSAGKLPPGFTAWPEPDA